jgi:hypothetical protein
MANPLVGDVSPFFPEEEQQPVDQTTTLEDELAKLGNARVKWPRITAFIAERQEFYRQFVPGGKRLTDMSAEERGNWWLCASTIIAEYDAFQDVVNEINDAKRRKPPTGPTEIQPS